MSEKVMSTKEYLEDRKKMLDEQKDIMQKEEAELAQRIANEKHLEELQKGANDLHNTYQAFLNSGFNEEQAFTLLRQLLPSQQNNHLRIGG